MMPTVNEMQENSIPEVIKLISEHLPEIFQGQSLWDTTDSVSAVSGNLISRAPAGP